jgi:hypothetical protein
MPQVTDPWIILGIPDVEIPLAHLSVTTLAMEVGNGCLVKSITCRTYYPKTGTLQEKAIAISESIKFIPNVFLSKTDDEWRIIDSDTASIAQRQNRKR